MSERSELHDAIERAIKEHCAGGDLWLCAHIASEPFDARIAELEREIERLDAQWREELRIYRETDGVDAERYRYLRGQAPPVPGECKRHIAVHVYDWARSFNQSDRFNMWSYVELSGDRLDAEIDAARANGGGE